VGLVFIGQNSLLNNSKLSSPKFLTNLDILRANYMLNRHFDSAVVLNMVNHCAYFPTIVRIVQQKLILWLVVWQQQFFKFTRISLGVVLWQVSLKIMTDFWLSWQKVYPRNFCKLPLVFEPLTSTFQYWRGPRLLHIWLDQPVGTKIVTHWEPLWSLL